MMITQHTILPSTGATNVQFIPSLFNETLQLLFEAHDYFDHEGYVIQEYLPEDVQMSFANEMSRITLRLTSIMAWLMIRKATFEGSMEEASDMETYRLEGRDVCMRQSDHLYEQLPKHMVCLLEESYALYMRVYRLDTQAPQPIHLH